MKQEHGPYYYDEETVDLPRKGSSNSITVEIGVMNEGFLVDLPLFTIKPNNDKDTPSGYLVTPHVDLVLNNQRTVTKVERVLLREGETITYYEHSYELSGSRLVAKERKPVDEALVTQIIPICSVLAQLETYQDSNAQLPEIIAVTDQLFQMKLTDPDQEELAQLVEELTTEMSHYHGKDYSHRFDQIKNKIALLASKYHVYFVVDLDMNDTQETPAIWTGDEDQEGQDDSRNN